ncbi:MAG: Smr/MutS family protein [Pseudomonadota bacterium]
MTSGSKKRGKGSDGLNKEDQELWQAFSKSVKPLERQKHIGKTAAKSESAGDSRETKRTNEHNRPRTKSATTAAGEKPNRIPAPVKIAPNLNQFDDRKVRRLNSGRLQVEARLDLHGMRQNEAHAALRRFLHSASSKDYRTVLIITGKGYARAGEADSEDYVSDRERGVLRRMLPNWLEQPEFRSIVVGYTSAGPRHGGDGAFYVQLRSARRRG